MTSRQSPMFRLSPRGAIFLSLVLPLAGAAGLPAQQSPSKTPAGEPVPKQKEQAAPREFNGKALVHAQLGLSQDGKTIVTFSNRKWVRWWDGDTGKLLERRALPVDFVDADAWLSSDGRLLAGEEGSAEERSVGVWDVRTGKRLQRLRGPQPFEIYAAVFSPDGKMLAATDIFGAIHLWEIASGKRRELKGRRPTFSPDGKRLASRDGRFVIYWDTGTGKQIWQKETRISDHDEFTFAFSPDGRTLIAAPHDFSDTWHGWDAATGKAAEEMKFPKQHGAHAVAVAAEGRTLVFADHPSIFNLFKMDRRIRIWDLRAGRLLHTLPVEGDIGPFFPDGKSFLGNDGTLQRWELATGRPLFAESGKPARKSKR